jgi:hypothetical protein
VHDEMLTRLCTEASVIAAAIQRGGHEGLAVPVIACAMSACCKAAGNVRPRLAARRRIPAAAFGESEYVGDICLCRTADKEHATAALGDSEILAVQHAPADSRPALP